MGPPPALITAVRSGTEALGLHGRQNSKIEKYTVQELNTKKAEGEKHFFSLFPIAAERTKPYENR